MLASRERACQLLFERGELGSGAFQCVLREEFPFNQCAITFNHALLVFEQGLDTCYLGLRLTALQPEIGGIKLYDGIALLDLLTRMHQHADDASCDFSCNGRIHQAFERADRVFPNLQRGGFRCRSTDDGGGLGLLRVGFFFPAGAQQQAETYGPSESKRAMSQR